uniref:Uncharacterized protein n=1 Tax=Anguilla anguilla TaxID=7936 RepID=A0A0E9QLS6_ANGAN
MLPAFQTDLMQFQSLVTCMAREFLLISQFDGLHWWSWNIPFFWS